MTDIVSIPVDLIDFPKKEKTAPGHVAALADSMREQGMLSPIVVCKDGGRYKLRAGLARLRAARRLKWKTIKALIVPRFMGAPRSEQGGWTCEGDGYGDHPATGKRYVTVNGEERIVRCDACVKEWLLDLVTSNERVSITTEDGEKEGEVHVVVD